MLKKNDVIKTTIVSMGCNMEGIARHDGFVIFVPFAILGEEVEIKILKVQKDYAYAKLLNVLSPSTYRTQPLCPYFTKCGGCDCQHIDYAYACELKRDMVKSTLEHICKCPIIVNNTVSSDNSYFYRNKVAFPVSPCSRKIGMYAPNSHRIVEIDNCLIQNKWVKELINCVNEYIEKSGVSVYDETTEKGTLRHVVARGNDDGVLVTLVINGNGLKNTKPLIDLLQSKFENFGLNLNINTKKSNAILTDKFVNICGLKELKFDEFGVKYAVGNGSFLQVNNYIKKAIYNAVLTNIERDEIVIEGYSGAGLMTAMLASKAKHVYGVEIVEEAVKSADELMKKNDIKNVTNICGKCEEEIPKLIGKIEKSIVVLDPPRKGCDLKVIEALAKAKPSKIIYVSCAPNTLGRDIKNLTELSCGAYEIESITPFDMFPQTKHVETLAVLKLKK